MSVTTYAATPGALTFYRDGREIVRVELTSEQAITLAYEVLRAAREARE